MLDSSIIVNRQMEPDYFQAYLVVAKIFTDLVKKTAMTVARGKPDPQVFLCSSLVSSLPVLQMHEESKTSNQDKKSTTRI